MINNHIRQLWLSILAHYVIMFLQLFDMRKSLKWLMYFKHFCSTLKDCEEISEFALKLFPVCVPGTDCLGRFSVTFLSDFGDIIKSVQYHIII